MSENICKTKFIRKAKIIKETSFDLVKIHIDDGFIHNFVKIFSIISDNKINFTSPDLVSYFNILVHLSQELLKQYHNNQLFIISIFSMVKFGLWNDCKLVRTSALRCLRYYMLNIFHMELFLKMRVDFLIMRSLDLSYEDAINNQYRGHDDAERIHAMRLLYRLSLISPKIFPTSLISSLTVICASVSEDNNVTDIAVRPALLILCQLLILNPNISFKNEILSALQTVIFNHDGKPWRFSFRIIEAVLLTQLKLITHLFWRQAMPPAYFNKTFTPFSILAKFQSEPVLDSGYLRNVMSPESEFEATSISVLLTILQSWPGLLYLYGAKNKPIVSLTGVLEVGCSRIRGRILDLLFQLFDIFRPPPECKDFVSCIRAIVDRNSAKYRPHWNVEDEFLLAQSNDCLSYISGNRMNIIDNYQAILIGMFVQCNLFEALECAVADDDESISARAGILLANISYKVSILLPADHPLASRSDGSALFKNPKSQKALLWIPQVHKLLEQNQFEFTPFLTYIIQQHPNNNVNEYGIQTKRFLQPSNIDEILDSCCLPMGSAVSKKNSHSGILQSSLNKNHRVGALLDQLVRHGRFLETCNEKAFYDLWDWDLLMVFARSLVDFKSSTNFDKESFSKVLKVLMKFFTIQGGSRSTSGDFLNSSNSDSIQQFALLPLTWKYSSQAAFVITDLICYLIETPKESEPYEELENFLIVVYSYLKDCLVTFVHDKYMEKVKLQFSDRISSNERFWITDYDLNYKCVSYLILAIGRMSVSDIGEMMLEKSGLVELFKAFIDYSRSDLMTKLILGSLDYTRPSLGRSLLSFAIKSDNLLIRRYSTNFLKVLLRAKVPFFANWGVNLLMKQIYDCDQIVKNSAYEILQEASEDEVVLNNLSVESISVLHMDFPGYMLYSRLLSLPSHFDKLQTKNGVGFFLDSWNKKFNLMYCETVDKKIMQYFTNYEIPNAPSDDPDDARISSRGKYKPKELILPCHPYGSISEHKEGMDVLLKRRDLEEYLAVIVKEWNNLTKNNFHMNVNQNFLAIDESELLLRSSMLAICHVATSAWGLKFTLDADIPLMISQLTQFHQSLNVRGTGLLCLGLIGSTRRGADILINYDWLSLRSDRFNKWPLLLDVFYNVQKNRIRIRKQLRNICDSSISLKSKSLLLDDENRIVYDSVDNLNIEYSSLNNSLTSCCEKTKQNHSSEELTVAHQNSGEEQQLTFSKLIHHHRELSAGTATTMSNRSDEAPESFSPHDVLGIATMRRLQRESRSGLFQSTNHPSCQNFMDQFSDDLKSDKSLLSDFSNIKKSSNSRNDFTKHRKKYSSFHNPRSNLRKYRGIVVPINLNDLTVNIFQSNQGKCSNIEMELNKIDNGSLDFINVNTDDSNKKNNAFDSNVISNADIMSKSFSLEESSCVLDIALLANDSTHISERIPGTKMLRHSSDEQPRCSDKIVSLRPRATTMDNGDLEKQDDVDFNFGNHNMESICSIVSFIREISLFSEDPQQPNMHNTHNGLTYHSNNKCLHVCCQENRHVTKETIEFRQKILKSVGTMLNISSKTKKMELNLARLKSCQDKIFWSDLCLYTEICNLMSIYSFSRQSRLYLQELFFSIPMSQLQDDMKMCFEEFSREIDLTGSFSTRL